MQFERLGNTNIKTHVLRDRETGKLIVAFVLFNQESEERLKKVLEKHFKNKPVNIGVLVEDFIAGEDVFSAVFFGEACSGFLKRQIPEEMKLFSKDDSISAIFAVKGCRIILSKEEFFSVVRVALGDAEFREAVAEEMLPYLEDDVDEEYDGEDDEENANEEADEE